jgi:hypothetical protein
MRKSIFITLLATFISASLVAQTLEEIKDAAGKNQWDKAKENIDKYLSTDKNTKKGDGWYLKAVIYNSISRDPKFAAQYGDTRMEAFNAYKKYLEVDKDNFEGKLNQHATLFDVSFGYLNKAAEAFNAKKFDEALTEFRNAEIVEDYIVSKNFSYGTFAYPAFDTQLYANIAAAAINAKKEDMAIQYYGKIADKKVKAKGYDEIYRYIVNEYDKKGDKANRDKYLAIGKELYPEDVFWCQVGLAEVWDDKAKLFAKFEEITKGPCDNYTNNYNYAVELYNHSFVGDTRPADFAATSAKIPVVLKKAITLNSTVEANMLMCRYYFGLINQIIDDLNAKGDDIKKKIKIGSAKADVIKAFGNPTSSSKSGTTETLVYNEYKHNIMINAAGKVSAITEIKNDDSKKQLDKYYDEMLPYAMAVYNTLDAKGTDLKTGEKGTFKVVCSMLLEYYERKGDAAKAKQYQDKMQSIQ